MVFTIKNCIQPQRGDLCIDFNATVALSLVEAAYVLLRSASMNIQLMGRSDGA